MNNQKQLIPRGTIISGQSSTTPTETSYSEFYESEFLRSAVETAVLLIPRDKLPPKNPQHLPLGPTKNQVVPAADFPSSDNWSTDSATFKAEANEQETPTSSAPDKIQRGIAIDVDFKPHDNNDFGPVLSPPPPPLLRPRRDSYTHQGYPVERPHYVYFPSSNGLDTPTEGGQNYDNNNNHNNHNNHNNPYDPYSFYGNQADRAPYTPSINDPRQNPLLPARDYAPYYARYYAPYYAPYQDPHPPSNFASESFTRKITTFVGGEISGRKFYNHNSDFPLDSTRPDFHPATANNPAPRLLPNPLKHRFLVEPDKQPEPVATIIGLTTEIFGPTDNKPLQTLVQQKITEEKIALGRELEELNKPGEPTTLPVQVSTNPNIPTLITPTNPHLTQNSKNMNFLNAQNFSLFFTALAMTLSHNMSAFILKVVDKFHHSAKEEVKNTAKVDAWVPITTTSPSVTPHATRATHTASNQDVSQTTPSSTAIIRP